MRKRVWRVGVIIVMALAIVGLVGTMVMAQAGTKRVGIVVRYGNGAYHTEIVRVPTNATVEGVLLASSLKVVIAQTAWGPALCKIGSEGCPAEDCFCASEFWAFWLLNASGPAWEGAAAGIGSITPADRDVVGFSWTASDENWNPIHQPPVFTFSQIEQIAHEIPEPATVVLLGSGLVGLGGYLGLRRRARH